MATCHSPPASHRNLPPTARGSGTASCSRKEAVEARQERLLGIWGRKLREELLLINAPVLATLQGSLDQDLAALLLTGKSRASTLKRTSATGNGG